MFLKYIVKNTHTALANTTYTLNVCKCPRTMTMTLNCLLTIKPKQKIFVEPGSPIKSH